MTQSIQEIVKIVSYSCIIVSNKRMFSTMQLHERGNLKGNLDRVRYFAHNYDSLIFWQFWRLKLNQQYQLYQDEFIRTCKAPS